MTMRKIGLIVHGDFMNCERGTIELHSRNVNHMEFIDCQMKVGGIVDQIITNLYPDNHIYIQMDNA